jgi:hypothetical protein
MCVLAVRGNPELEARRDKLVVRMILYLTLCHVSRLTSEFLLLGAASVTSGRTARSLQLLLSGYQSPIKGPCPSHS